MKDPIGLIINKKRKTLRILRD
uniref:Uncharacterized protein n=1 Tax=Rhizophora mucronata TaxID=61149 RepID=A0A2P2QKJ5_RHIMU